MDACSDFAVEMSALSDWILLVRLAISLVILAIFSLLISMNSSLAIAVFTITHIVFNAISALTPPLAQMVSSYLFFLTAQR